MTRAEREIVAAMRADIKRLELESEGLRWEYGKFDNALNYLMRFIGGELADRIHVPTSINAGRMIAALAEVSRIVHNDDGNPYRRPR